MPDVALISSLTYRPEAEQRKTYPNYPQFTLEEIPTMLRPSQRNAALRVHVLSLAIIAETEDDFREFLNLMKVRKAALHCKEDELRGERKTADQLVKLWRAARRNGAAVAGGQENSKRAELNFWRQFAIIKDDWHGPEKSEVLMKRSKIRHHDTFRSYLLFTRWEWRRLTDGKRASVLKQRAADLKKRYPDG
jgi:hypothetical protein